MDGVAHDRDQLEVAPFTLNVGDPQRDTAPVPGRLVGIRGLGQGVVRDVVEQEACFEALRKNISRSASNRFSAKNDVSKSKS